MEDVQIIDLYWQRDESAISETDSKYGRFCQKLAMNILHSFQDSEECVSDTYGKCWDTMPPQRPMSLRAYLGTIIRNLSISRYRASHAQKRFGGAEVLLSELAGFTLEHTETLEFSFTVDSAAQVQNLLSMTPHFWRISKEGAARLSAVETLTDTAQVIFNLYRKE